MVDTTDYNETFRPQFHFTARKNWLNDPNGLFYYKGIYHLFFQHNPSGLEWGNMTWGHAISPDLVHWQQLPNALEPDPLGTMFSGSAVVDWENTTGFQQEEHPPIVLIYTAAGNTSRASEGKPFTQCLAYSTDGARTWQKYPANPVLACIRPENRDPKVIWHAPSHRWIMTLYLDGNEFAFFSSPDLKTWSPLHTLFAPNSIECPDFFEIPLEGSSDLSKWVWIAGNGCYYVGNFDGRRFQPETDLLIGDYGANFYACQTYSDAPEGRRIQIAWMRGGKYPGMPFNQQMSFPCELRLFQTPLGWRLSRFPIREIETLYIQRHFHSEISLQNHSISIPNLKSWLLDFSCQIEPESNGMLEINIHGQKVVCDLHAGTISCLGQTAPLYPLPGPLDMRILVDRTSLEVFAQNGLISITSCYLPESEFPEFVGVAQSSRMNIRNFTLWELGSSWPQRNIDEQGVHHP